MVFNTWNIPLNCLQDKSYHAYNAFELPVDRGRKETIKIYIALVKSVKQVYSSVLDYASGNISDGSK